MSVAIIYYFLKCHSKMYLVRIIILILIKILSIKANKAVYKHSIKYCRLIRYLAIVLLFFYLNFHAIERLEFVGHFYVK